MFRVENVSCSTNGLHTEAHKSIPVHYGQWAKIFKSAF